MLVHTFDPSARQERQTDLLVQRQPGLQSKFLNSQGYMEKSCPKTPPNPQRKESIVLPGPGSAGLELWHSRGRERKSIRSRGQLELPSKFKATQSCMERRLQRNKRSTQTHRLAARMEACNLLRPQNPPRPNTPLEELLDS